MDILKSISDSEFRDIVISLPRDKSWLEYLGHFMELKASGSYVEILLQSLPKVQTGNKCYIIYDGHLKGWMEISKIRESEENEICVELIPYLSSMPNMPMADIEGFKYFLDNSDMQ